MFMTSFRIVVFYLILAAATTCATALPSLVPSRRVSSYILSKRAPCHEDVAPKTTASLHYAIAPHDPATAIITFDAHPGQPILLLEDIDHLLNGLSCSGRTDGEESSIHVRFDSNEVHALAHESWSELEKFVILTAHSDCNPRNERGAWRVKDVKPDFASMALVLSVEPISMRDVGRSFRVRYDHSGIAGVKKRAEEGLEQTYSVGFTPDLPSRFPLFPPNATIDDNVPTSTISALQNAELDLTCVNCGLQSNISLGLDYQVNIADTTCATNSSTCFTIGTAALNMTIQDLSLTTELEVFVGKEISSGSSYPVLHVPIAPSLHVPELIDIGPAVGLDITFAVDVSANINFTYGATGGIPNGAFASVSLIDSTGTFNPSVDASGWDQIGVQQIPFRVNGGVFNITASVALAPYAEVDLTVLDIGSVLRLATNLPLLEVSAELRTNVNRDCNDVGANDFEFFGGAFLVGAGMELSSVASFDVDEGVFSSQGIPDHWNRTLFDVDIPLAPAHGRNTSTCLVISDDAPPANATAPATVSAPSSSGTSASATSSLSPLPGTPASTGTLYPAASAVPTWDFSKIESYFSASSQLPTNVNYTQMVQATAVPDQLKPAVSSAAKAQAQSAASSAGTPQPTKKKSGAASQAKAHWQALLLSVTFLVACSWL